jgi:hypothetical protein
MVSHRLESAGILPSRSGLRFRDMPAKVTNGMRGWLTRKILVVNRSYTDGMALKIDRLSWEDVDRTVKRLPQFKDTFSIPPQSFAILKPAKTVVLTLVILFP